MTAPTLAVEVLGLDITPIRIMLGLFSGLVYGLLGASVDAPSLTRALEIVEQLPDIRGPVALPIREARTLTMELLLHKALEQGLEAAVLDSPAYRRYAEQRRSEGLDGATA